MRASGGTDALKPQTPRPIDTVSTKRTERTALEGRMAASASFADAQAPPPEDRLWPTRVLCSLDPNVGNGAERKFAFRRTCSRARSPAVRSNLRGQIAGDAGQSACL